MTVILRLPPQEAPKGLTANVLPKNLQEHLLAFLNANNEKGFVEEKPGTFDLSTIGGILTDFIQHESTNGFEYLEVVKKIADLLLKDNIGFSRSKILKKSKNIAAMAIGYRNYNHVRDACCLGQAMENARIPILMNAMSADAFVGKSCFTVSQLKIRIDKWVLEGLPVFNKDKSTADKLMQYMMHLDFIPEKSFKNNATRLKQVFNGELKHNEVLNVMAYAFGYDNYQEALEAKEKDPRGVFVNRRKLLKEV